MSKLIERKGRLSLLVTAALAASTAAAFAQMQDVNRYSVRDFDPFQPKDYTTTDPHQYFHPGDYLERHPESVYRRYGATVSEVYAESVALDHLPGGRVTDCSLDLTLERQAFVVTIEQDKKLKRVLVDAQSGAFLGVKQDKPAAASIAHQPATGKNPRTPRTRAVKSRLADRARRFY